MTIALELLRRFWPYIVAFAVGFSMAWGVAWGIQGLRLSSAKQELTEYKFEQQRIVQQSIDLMNKKRKEASDDYQAKQKQLEVSIRDGEVFRRCVAAGRCGVRVVPTCSPGISVSPKLGGDAGGTDAISALTGAAETPVVNDCAKTTLILNQLQREVENQEGYKE